MLHWKNWQKKKLIVIMVSCAVVVGGGSYYAYIRFSQSVLITLFEHRLTIRPFDSYHDMSFILDIFKRDWYWLIGHLPEFSAEYIEDMFQNRTSSRKLERRGNLTIKVGYYEQHPVGFVVYYKKNFYLGKILFIDVVPEFRSQGYAYELFDYAVKDLIRLGALKIDLVTRTNNFAAQKLYKRYGFREARVTDGYVYFDYMVQ